MDVFKDAGTVTRTEIHSTPEGRSKGSGVVEFSTPEEATAAIEKYDRQDLGGRMMMIRANRVGIREPREAPPPAQLSEPWIESATNGGSMNPTIHVANLPWSTTDDDLVDLFSTIATVTKTGVQHDNGRSRGSGIVQFETAEMADSAIQKFQGYVYGSRYGFFSLLHASANEIDH